MIRNFGPFCTILIYINFKSHIDGFEYIDGDN